MKWDEGQWQQSPRRKKHYSGGTKMQTSKILAGAIWVLCAQSVYAGQVNNLTTFTTNTPAKAAEVNGNFGAVQTAVDDNDARINASTSTINFFVVCFFVLVF